jgi:exosortase A
MDPTNSVSLGGGAASGRWASALAALFAALAWVLAWYWDTAAAMVGIWARSETFTHAFLVPPISLWLIWRQRHALAGLTPRPNLPVVILAAAAGFAWLLGELAAVNAVTQLALVSLLVLAVPALLGLRIATAMMFPLAYLFFAVPIGEFVMPTMMEWTADFTVRALLLTGIPVYREGLQFVIPSGNWSVVEACSGVRYLIASVTVGTLYAYLNYRSTWRRLVFIGVSILVPIVANWLRAYMIVMMGHLSGNKLAVGVDHLIYGWVFFGFVIFLMFVIGARWAEHPAAEECVATGSGDASGPASRLWPAAVLFALATALPVLWQLAIERAEAARPMMPALRLPAPAGWQAAQVRTIQWRPVYASPSAELQQEFVRGGERVGVFAAAYRRQDYGSKLISSTNVLVSSADREWTRVGSGARSINLPAGPQTVRTAELRSTAGQRLAVWQWYWIGGRLTTSDHLAKLYQALDRLTGWGDDSAVIVVYVPVTESKDEKALTEFVQVFPLDAMLAGLR